MSHSEFRNMVFEPRNPDFEARTRESFARQSVMTLIGARMTRADA